jgi:putative aldouronate transport system substrate-binding protein
MMTKKTFGWAALTALMLVAFTLLVGCNKAATTTSTPAPSAEATESGAVALSDAVLKELGLEKDASGNYKFTNPVNITVEVFDRGMDGGRTKPEDNFYTNYIKAGMLRDHNVNVTYVPVGRWSETTDMNNLLAAGTAPDVGYSYDYSMVLQYANMGGITDLNPIINKYPDLFPGIWDWLGGEFINYDQDPTTSQLWALEGKISNEAMQNVFVRQDWLKALNISTPKTVAEFTAMLQAFKDNASTLLGSNAGQMVPFLTTTDIGWMMRELIVSFIPANLSDKDWYVTGFDDRHLMRPSTVSGEVAAKSALRILNDWYNKGLVWKDFALYGDDAAASDNLIKSGVVGAFMQNWDMPYRNGKDSYSVALHNAVGPDADFIAIQPFPNSAGTPWHVTGPRVDRKAFVPASAKNPIAALFYLDWVHQVDNLRFIQFGNEGVTHTTNPDGSIVTISVTGEQIMNSPNNIDYTQLINGPRMPTADLVAKTMALSYPDTASSIVEQAYIASSANTKTFANVNLGAITEEEGMGNVLSEKRNAFYANAVVAPTAQFNSVFDAGYKDYLSTGGQAIIDARTARWTQFFGNATAIPSN